MMVCFKNMPNFDFQHLILSQTCPDKKFFLDVFTKSKSFIIGTFKKVCLLKIDLHLLDSPSFHSNMY